MVFPGAIGARIPLHRHRRAAVALRRAELFQLAVVRPDGAVSELTPGDSRIRAELDADETPLDGQRARNTLEWFTRGASAAAARRLPPLAR